MRVTKSFNKVIKDVSERRRGLVGKTVALAAEGRRFKSTVW